MSKNIIINKNLELFYDKNLTRNLFVMVELNNEDEFFADPTFY
jgi:hypothetical protein